MDNDDRSEKRESTEDLLAIASFLSTTVHDLKNPLTNIRGLSQLGEMKSKSSEEKEYFRKIIGHVDSLTEMLNESLSIFNPEKFNLISPINVIQETIKEIEPFCNVNKVELKFYFSNTVDILLHKPLLKRAIYNLFKNAVNAMPEGGKIVSNISQVADSILISIEDTGPGLPLEIQENIFKPFIKGDKESSTGLGLYMVYYTITKVHRGHVWFNTKQGSGTSFFIELPVDNS